MANKFPLRGKGAYKGKHWTQLPENKEKLAAMARKIGSMRRKTFKTIAKAAVKTKRGPYKTKKNGEQPFVIRTHGYRIILDKNEIRIEHE
jgi:hypothetical protein